ncbi:transposase [Pandoraea iniqua]|uniref:Transposase n=1 Tax=Pandoraea iniqua TaxID=2508288 RepID=A0A5E4YIU9_9BURK|nr:transposase [Pandoraea iniqua]
MDVLTGPECRRRWLPDEKLAIVRESNESSKTVSMVARRHGTNPNQLLHWHKPYQDGSLLAVSASEEVVPASELSDALKQIRELQRMLSKTPIENEILREVVEVAKSRKWTARSPSMPEDEQ